MKSMLRNVLAFIVACWLAIPTTGNDTEGGENNSGTGVWILPCYANVSSLTGQAPVSPRMEIVISNLTTDVCLRVSDELGSAAGTFIDDVTGVPVSLPVTGRLVVIKQALLHALAQGSIPTATVVVTDANQRGYLVRMKVTEEGSFVLRVD